MRRKREEERGGAGGGSRCRKCSDLKFRLPFKMAFGARHVILSVLVSTRCTNSLSSSTMLKPAAHGSLQFTDGGTVHTRPLYHYTLRLLALAGRARCGCRTPKSHRPTKCCRKHPSRRVSPLLLFYTALRPDSIGCLRF